MSAGDKLTKILRVLDARVLMMQAKMSRELHLKDELRARQLAIVAQEESLISGLAARAVHRPTEFRYGEIRLQKLASDQRRLQPVLAQAALQRARVQDDLKAALRQKLGVEFAQKRRAEIAARSRIGTGAEQVLFEMQKGR